MTHPRLEELDALLDGELDQLEAHQLETHLDSCRECQALRAERTALRAAIEEALVDTRAAVPDLTRQRLVNRLRAEPLPGAGWPMAWPGLVAAMLLLAVLSYQFGRRTAAAEQLTSQVLASHVRSLQPGHLTDVLSSDQHTVKPWFDGRLDYSPPVQDLASIGYPLQGGRLDYLGGRPVAVLVYGRRQHLINVYLWPTGRLPKFTPTSDGERLGYHIVGGTGGDFTWFLVSDLGRTELAAFNHALEQAVGQVTGAER